jgi:hypothetical protein
LSPQNRIFGKNLIVAKEDFYQNSFLPTEKSRQKSKTSVACFYYKTKKSKMQEIYEKFTLFTNSTFEFC